MKTRFLFFVTTIILSSAAFANDVQTVGIGIGASNEAAIQSALRNALENVYGVYISSSTTMSDDRILNDDITSVSFGKIINYKVIDSTKNSAGQYIVTVDAKVSLDKLATFIGESTGASIKFDGVGWGIQQKMERLNIKNEEKAAMDIVKTIKNLDIDCTPSISIQSMDQNRGKSKNCYTLTLTVKLNKKGNSREKELHEFVENSFKALKNPKTKEFLSNLTARYYQLIKLYIDSQCSAFAIKDEGNGNIYPIYHPTKSESFLDHAIGYKWNTCGWGTMYKLYTCDSLGYNWQLKKRSAARTNFDGSLFSTKTILINISYTEENLEKVTKLSIVPLPTTCINALKEYYFIQVLNRL